MSHSNPRAVRVYSFHLNGVPVSKPFVHPGGLSPDELNRELNRQFHAWLETLSPGAYAEGRVHGLRFADDEVDDPGMVA